MTKSMKALLFFSSVASLLAVTIILCDAYLFIPYSVHRTLRVDLASVEGNRKAWCTTHYVLMDSDTWHPSNFQLMTHVSASIYEVEVGASRKTSVVFRRRGVELWSGRLLIIVERGNGLYDALLVYGSPETFSIKIEKHHQIFKNIELDEFSDKDGNRK